MFRGSIVAIVTPFKGGKIDEEAYRELIEFQIENGTSAIVPSGTTGESATLNMQEHARVIDIAVEAVKKRVPVIAGTGGNSTSEAIELTAHAKKVGADATLQVAPYYNKPTPEGLYQHFKAIAKAVPLPQVLYNVPGRTSVNMLMRPWHVWPNSPRWWLSKRPQEVWAKWPRSLNWLVTKSLCSLGMTM